MLVGETRLTYDFPYRFEVVSPTPDEVLPRTDASIEWNASLGATRYKLEVESMESDFSIEVILPADQTEFCIPAAILDDSVSYEYSLTAQGDNDNETEMEGTFRVRD